MLGGLQLQPQSKPSTVSADQVGSLIVPSAPSWHNNDVVNSTLDIASPGIGEDASTLLTSPVACLACIPPGLFSRVLPVAGAIAGLHMELPHLGS